MYREPGFRELSINEGLHIVVKPGPSEDYERSEQCNVTSQEHGMESSMQEQPLGQTAPVDRPLVEELTSEIKGSSQVADGGAEQERSSQNNLCVRVFHL